MVDPTPDPIDQAYRDAETLLTEQAERSARRARILAAIAQDNTIDPVVRHAPRFISRTGWLVAASIMVVSFYLVLRVLPSQQPGPPSVAQTAAIKPIQKNERMAALSPPAPAINLPEPAPAAPKAHLSEQAPIITRERAGPPSKPVVPAIPPPPAAMITPPPAIAAAAPPAAAESVTVTGTMLRSPAAIVAAPPPAMAAAPPAAAPAARADTARPMAELDELRAAAAAGRTADVQQLLDGHIPVDSPDADGETALMKSVRANQPATAALLIRYGASLDKKNNAGFSARDLATQLNNPALKRALGLQP